MPKAFLALIQFGTMLVERALYPWKALLGKCAFQVFLVLGTHFRPFFILPGVTKRYPDCLAGPPFSLPTPHAPGQKKKGKDPPAWGASCNSNGVRSRGLNR